MDVLYTQIEYKSDLWLKCLNCNEIMESMENGDVCLKCGLFVVCCDYCNADTCITTECRELEDDTVFEFNCKNCGNKMKAYCD